MSSSISGNHVISTVVIGILIVLISITMTKIFKSPRSAMWTPVTSELIDTKGRKLSSINDDPTVDLSIVIPAYNESKRIMGMLQETMEYLKSDSCPYESIEILVVDDGSRDNTVDVVEKYFESLKPSSSSKPINTHLVKLARNRGKGAAVKHGVMHASGQHILFADADGATNISGLNSLKAAVEKIQVEKEGKSYAIAVGSRAHLVNTDAVVKRSAARNILMRGFHLYLYIMGIRSIQDTQCGFKLFTRPAAADVYPYLHCASWIFDCEILLVAIYTGIPIAEVPVDWHEVPGSKVSIISDSIGMARDLFVLRFNYWTNRWSLPAKIN